MSKPDALDPSTQAIEIVNLADVLQFREYSPGRFTTKDIGTHWQVCGLVDAALVHNQTGMVRTLNDGRRDHIDRILVEDILPSGSEQTSDRYAIAARDVQGRIVGVAGYRDVSGVADRGELLLLSTHQDVRNRGLGSLLLRELLVRGRDERGHCEVDIAATPRSVGFYARHGAEIIDSPRPTELPQKKRLFARKQPQASAQLVNMRLSL